jgi:hypothetical protein
MRAYYPQEKARREVYSCIEAWKTIFETRFEGRIEYAYAKGSGVKEWSSPIDYVPLLSDVDIHVKKMGDESLFGSPETAVEEALEVSGEYERLFLEMNTDPLHVPRTQVVVLNDAVKDPRFLLPLESDEIHVMFGEPELRKALLKEKVRVVDYENLMELEGVLRSLPMSAMDKTGLEYWYLIRRLVWHVSPAPVRLLTQVVEDPEEAWMWNRTKVCDKLEEHGFHGVSQSYRDYYLLGWEMFFTGLRDTRIMRRVVSKAYDVLESTLRLAKRIDPK